VACRGTLGGAVVADCGVSAVTRDMRLASVSQVCEMIWRMERELGLLERRVGDTFYWPLIRYTVASEIIRTVFRLSAAQPNLVAPWPWKVANNLRMFATDLRAPFWQRNEPVDAILLPHPRRLQTGRGLLDVNSESVLTDPGLQRLLVFEQENSLAIYKAFPGRQARYCGMVGAIAQAKGRLRAGQFLDACASEHRGLTEFLWRAAGLAFPYPPSWLAIKIAIFVEQRALWRKIIALSGARRLFVVTGYAQQAVIAAAKDAGLTTIELQHALIGPYHLGYSYPGRAIVPYACDRLAVFGRYWQSSVELPGNMQSFVAGSTDMAHQSRLTGVRRPKSVLVVSQGTIGELLFRAVLDAAAQARDWHFKFRVHPGENVRLYQAMLRQQGRVLSNVSLAAPNDRLGDDLRASEVQLGVYSTALVEGMALGVRTLVLNLPGADQMQHLIARGDALLIDDPSEIPSALERAPLCGTRDALFAPPLPSISAAVA
jgi:hypothetical protein